MSLVPFNLHKRKLITKQEISIWKKELPFPGVHYHSESICSTIRIHSSSRSPFA